MSIHSRLMNLCLAILTMSGTCLAQDFKVIGYLPNYRLGAVPHIEFERLTHVNIAFANPDALGNLSFEGFNVQGAIDTAHAAGCKVFVSLGGGVLRPEWETAWDSLAQPSRRSAFISQILNFISTQGFDGVDMDLEWQYVKSWYSPFVIELSTALKPLGLPLTAALPGMHRYALVSDSALAVFDWVNMMIYDKTGPWDPQNPGQHSPLDWAAECIAYWKSQGLTSDKLTVGVPFYGYDFSTVPPSSFTYNQVVQLDPSNALRDEVDGKYWNGIPTIIAKTSLALEQAGGIMIWELGQDAFGPNAPLSLLRAIDDEIDATVSGVESIAAIDMNATIGVGVYPNPVIDAFTVRALTNAAFGSSAASGNSSASSSDGESASGAPQRIVICDALGAVVYDATSGVTGHSMNTAGWTSGTYYLRLHTPHGVRSAMVVKR